MRELKKNEVPRLCRYTQAVCDNYEGGKLFIMIITENDKSAKIPSGFRRVGKSFLGERSNKGDYPHGNEIKDGTYVWFAPLSSPLVRWQKIKV